MAKKEHSKHHEHGLGLKMVGSPTALINKVIPGEGAEWALAQITDEGPAHKQVQNALLFKQLTQLVKTVEKVTGMPFASQKGQTVFSKGPEHETEIPVTIPQSSLKGFTNTEEILEKMSKGPEHEILMYGIVLQVVDWANKEIKNYAKQAV